MVKTFTFKVTTIHIIRGNYHPARLSTESAMYREWWFWWKTSHCNTMQKQTHYEYYYFNKLIQVYKARKSNIAFTRLFQHSTIISWSSGCVQNLIKVFKSRNHFLLGNWTNSLSLVIFNRSDDWEIAFPLKMIMS